MYQGGVAVKEDLYELKKIAPRNVVSGMSKAFHDLKVEG